MNSARFIFVCDYLFGLNEMICLLVIHRSFCGQMGKNKKQEENAGFIVWLVGYFLHCEIALVEIEAPFSIIIRILNLSL